MGGGEVEVGAGGVLGSPTWALGAPPPAAVSENCFPFIVGSVSATQRRSQW